MVASLRPKSIIFEVSDDSVTSDAIVVPVQRRGSWWDTRAAAVVLATGVVGGLVLMGQREREVAGLPPAPQPRPSLATVNPSRIVPAQRPRPRPRRREVPAKHPKRHRRHRARAVAPVATPAPPPVSSAAAHQLPLRRPQRHVAPAGPANGVSREFF